MKPIATTTMTVPRRVVFTAGKRAIELLEGEEVISLCLEPEFQAGWEALYRGCSWATVFQSRQFVTTWYQIYQNDYLPILIKAEQHGKLTGLLAMARNKNGLIIGAGANQAEYQAWLAADALGEDFIHSALLEVRKRFPGNGIRLKYIHDKVPLSWIVDHSIWNKRCFLQAVKQSYMVINDEVLTKKLRKPNRRNKINRLKRLGELKFERITGRGELAAVIDELSTLSDFRKGAMYNKFYFREDLLKKEFLLALAELNILHVSVLKLNDKIIASNIGTAGKDLLSMHSGINSHDPSFAKYSPGILHFLLLGKLLVEEGVEILDLGPGVNSYKEEITTDAAQLYVLSIDSVYHTALFKIKSKLTGLLKKLTSVVGIEPGVLKRIKINAVGYNKSSFIKGFINQARWGRATRKYEVEADNLMSYSACSINIQQDSLCDLLDFEQDRKTRLERRGFLADAMRRFDAGEQCYSLAENGRLLSCVWLQKSELSGGEEGQSSDPKVDALVLQGLYCHSSALNGMKAFLVTVAASIGSGQVYVETGEPMLCQGLEAAGFKACRNTITKGEKLLKRQLYMQSSTQKKNQSFPISTAGITKPRILIFIGSLCHGGKERRLIELLTYFKAETNFEFLVVLTKDDIHYQHFFNLCVPYKVITKTWKRNDPTVIFKLYRICKEFQPHLIHTWGRMQSFYILPAVIGQNIPLINSQITGAPVKLNKWSFSNFIDRLNFHFSKVILSNSKAGIGSYNPPVNKTKVIHNGINLNRFRNLPGVEKVKAKYGITTPYTVVMVAAFTYSKDYGLFYRVADKVTRLRDDISFIGVGGYREDESEYRRLLELSSQNPKILFTGLIKDVEALVNACTIGVLFSTNGEGISNSIMEYMALGKPVIANDAGGMRELVRHNVNGYLITKETEEEIAALIIELIDDQEKNALFGRTGKKIIEESFSLDRMGKAFERVYNEVMI